MRATVLLMLEESCSPQSVSIEGIECVWAVSVQLDPLSAPHDRPCLFPRTYLLIVIDLTAVTVVSLVF